MAKATSRAPRRCRKCDGSPLLSQCIHTPAGRQYISEKEADTGISNDETHDVSLASMMSLMQLPPHPPSGNELPQLPLPALTPADGRPSPAQIPGELPQAMITSENEMLSLAIDPQLQDYHMGTETDHAALPAGTDTDHATPGDDPGTPNVQPSTPSTPNVPRATVKNPLHGLVEGVKRGNDRHAIARQQPLPRPLTSATLSTRRFNRIMQDLIIRCERLSVETGCWLYISGQHVNANMGFYSYASPRIRREARGKVAEVQNSFNKIYTGLLSARRLEALELTWRARQAEEELQQVQQQVADKDAEIAALQSALLAQSTLLVQSNNTEF